MTNDYDADEALSRLESVELKKYIKGLKYYLANPQDEVGLYLAVDNAIQLSDWTPKLQDYSYDSSMFDYLQQIANILPDAIANVTDRNLKKILEDNLDVLYGYLAKVYKQSTEKPDDTEEMDNKEYIKKVINPYYEYETPELREHIKNLTKQTKETELGQEWKNIADNLADSYNRQPVDPQSPDIDTFIVEGMKRFRQRAEEYTAMNPKAPELSKSLSPEAEFRLKVLDPLAKRILMEESA